MKRVFAIALFALLPSAAWAHEAGIAHVHPHTDWSLMLVLGAFAALAGFVVLRRQGRNKKGD